MINMKLTTISVFLFLLFSLSFATTICVNKTTDATCYSNSGCTASYNTIPAAVTAAPNGTTVIVCNEHYDGTNNVTIQNSINLYGYQYGQVFLENYSCIGMCMGNPMMINTNNAIFGRINISNFTFYNNTGGIAMSYSNTHIFNNNFTRVETSIGLYGMYDFGSGIYYAPNSSIIENNIFNLNQSSNQSAMLPDGPGGPSLGSIGISVSSPEAARLSHVIIRNNTFTGISQNGVGVFLAGAYNFTIQNNTFTTMNVSVLPYNYSSPTSYADGIIISNNTISGNNYSIYNHMANYTTIIGNTITNNTNGARLTGNYINITNNNFSIAPYGTDLLQINGSYGEISANVFTSYAYRAIYMFDGGSTLFRNNTMIGNGLYNCSAGYDQYGLILNPSLNNSIINNSIINNSCYEASIYYGVSDGNNTGNNIVTGNTFSGAGLLGLQVFASSNNSIINNNFSGDLIGIVLMGCSYYFPYGSCQNNQVTYNNFNNNVYAINGATQIRLNVSYNTINNATDVGLLVRGINGTIDRNNVSNSYYGFRLYGNIYDPAITNYEWGNIISNNRMINNTYGFVLNGSGNATYPNYYLNNVVINSSLDGFHLTSGYSNHTEYAINNIFTSNVVNNSGRSAFSLNNQSNNNQFINNTCNNNQMGFYVKDSLGSMLNGTNTMRKTYIGNSTVRINGGYYR